MCKNTIQIKKIFNCCNLNFVICTFGVFIVFTFLTDDASAAHWPTPTEEQQDEINDLQIIKAVQNSMSDYEKRHKNEHHRQKRAEKSVCYDELGCFEDSGPFGYLDMLPQSPEEINTRFYFYSTESRSDRPLLELPYLGMNRVWSEWDGNSTTNLNTTEDNSTSRIDAKRNNLTLKTFEGLDRMSVRIIVHGFGSACRHVWIYEMRTALMAVEDCIVICVDWETGALLPNYVRAAANTRLVGKQLALFVKGLQEYKGLDLERAHIIGFSLGAHVSGFAGSDLPGLRRITGLDPAGPLFESQHTKARLDSNDANFVDVIHSNGENLILGGLGSWQPMGDVDFYPNGGRVQTGCSNIFVGAVTDFIWSPSAVVEGRSLCNHRRAYKFFIDSVASKCLFPAFPCDSYDNFLKGTCFKCDEGDNYKDARCGNMGYYADKSTGRGQLYLVTREEEPFCAHQFNIEIFTAESDLPLRTIGKIEATLHGDHSLNETFSITEKEDSELFAGNVISRILVPHPALGFPKSIALTYKTYSGWLSRGLPYWMINKISLTDSYGQTYSMCRNYMLLESGNPIVVNLASGNCEPTTENLTYGPHNESATRRNDVDITTDSYADDDDASIDDDVDKLREKKNIFNSNSNSTYKIDSRKEWNVYVENGNSLERNLVESSRSFNDHHQNSDEIFEPILKDRHIRKPNIGRSFDLKDKPQMHEEIFEPILKASPQRNRKTKQLNANDENRNIQEKGYFNVQLLPFRIGELFERAERYARETLLPLISEQAPRFFGFGSDRDEPNERKPKYIPKIGELRNASSTAITALATPILAERVLNQHPPQLNVTDIVIDDNFNETETYSTAEIFQEDLKIPLPSQPQTEAPTTRPRRSRDSKNILSLLRERPPVKATTSSTTVVGIQQTLMSALSDEQETHVSSARYYTNAEAIDNDDYLKIVRIVLPTYKPIMNVNRNPFPYKYDANLK